VVVPRTDRSTRPAGEHAGGEADTDVERSFERFFAAEYRRVVGLAVALCQRPSIAEELAQDAFVKAFSRWDRICRYDDPGAWVRRVVVNLAMSSLRRRSREVRMLARIALRREPSTEPVVGDEAFWSAVRDLPRREAQCVALRYVDDRSTAAIASVLDIAESTVRVHLRNARLRLAAVLSEDLDEEGT
jgi:RNA polymerase sigma-70 factor (ECF subfamily)